MKVNPRTALEHRGEVKTGPFETTEQHGRELQRKGYATIIDDVDGGESKAPAKRTSRKAKPKADSE